jgi:hypothetical protein
MVLINFTSQIKKNVFTVKVSRCVCKIDKKACHENGDFFATFWAEIPILLVVYKLCL